jgi:hypothetical protein
MRRLFIAAAVASAVALPVSVTAVAFAGPASAAATPVACKKLSGTITGSITISKCSPKSKTNKSAGGLAASLASGGTITWTPSNQTTTVSLSVSSPGQGACKKGSTEYDVTGSVTGGTSTYTHSGDAVAGKACATSGGSLSLVKHTSLTL